MTRCIAITSGKGGVGKSTISANISNILANAGYRVALFDADIGLANLDIILNVKLDKKQNLLNVMKGECSIKDVIVNVKPNLVLIPGDSGDEIFSVSADFLNQNFVKEMSLLDGLDFVVIDTGAGIDANVQPFLNASDEVIIVTTPDPAAITDAYATLKVTNKFKEKIYMFFNMSEDDNETAHIFSSLQNIAKSNLSNKIELKLLGFLSKSQQVANSVRTRKLFTDDYPNIEATIELKEAVSNFLVDMNKQGLEIGSRVGGFSRFLRRLKGLL